MPAYSDTPVDYTTLSGLTGLINITVEDGEDIADLITTNTSGTVALRLDRRELAALIASAAQAMAALDC